MSGYKRENSIRRDDGRFDDNNTNDVPYVKKPSQENTIGDSIIKWLPHE